MMFLECPAYLDHERTRRCGLPAEVTCRFTMRSTDGPIECAMIRCPVGHYFNGAIESLTLGRKNNHDSRIAELSFRATHHSVQGSHDRRDVVGGIAIRDFPVEPNPEIFRPNTAPAYYLGHPARLWIAVMNSNGRRTPSRLAMRTLTAAGKPTDEMASTDRQLARK
jgi:hypothetical protein